MSRKEMIIEKVSMMSGTITKKTMLIDAVDYASWCNGKRIQEAMPYLDKYDREFLLSGLTDKEMGDLYGYRLIVKDTVDGDIEINYSILSDGSYLLNSAGVVGDLHIDCDELRGLGLLDKYNEMLLNHFKAI